MRNPNKTGALRVSRKSCNTEAVCLLFVYDLFLPICQLSFAPGCGWHCWPLSHASIVMVHPLPSCPARPGHIYPHCLPLTLQEVF